VNKVLPRPGLVKSDLLLGVGVDNLDDWIVLILYPLDLFVVEPWRVEGVDKTPSVALTILPLMNLEHV